MFNNKPKTKRLAISVARLCAENIIEQLERIDRGWDKGVYRDDDTLRFMTIKQALRRDADLAFRLARTYTKKITLNEPKLTLNEPKLYIALIPNELMNGVPMYKVRQPFKSPVTGLEYYRDAGNIFFAGGTWQYSSRNKDFAVIELSMTEKYRISGKLARLNKTEFIY